MQEQIFFVSTNLKNWEILKSKTNDIQLILAVISYITIKIIYKQELYTNMYLGLMYLVHKDKNILSIFCKLSINTQMSNMLNRLTK